MMGHITEIMAGITRGTTEIITREALEEKFLESQRKKRPLKIKAGFDPTAPDIHLGHCILLRKLRQFQELGHEIYFLIGDFTAQIGDPSGRDQTRPPIDARQIARNTKTYTSQVFKILDPQKTKIVFNSQWLKRLTAQEILELTAHSTVAQMLARADFKKRFEEKQEITLLEFIYPLLQGYDSVYLKADVELGGSDQKFNLLMGRQLQERYGLKPQAVVMIPLLEGTDGIQKMSKSVGNYIGVTEPPHEIFGKVMSLSDELMKRYYELLTDVDLKSIERLHPKEAKLQLAATLVQQLYDEKKAARARENFEKTFSQRQVPHDIRVYPLDDKKQVPIMTILLEAKLVASRNEARRLIQQGALTHDGARIESEQWPARPGVLKLGKRRFLKLTSAVR